MGKFIGRHVELSLLKRYMERGNSSLIVVRGRRRIGKSTLIKKFAKNYNFFSFEGLAPTDKTTAEQQRNEFARQLSVQTGLPPIQSSDWMGLFQLLWEKSKTEQVVILFDEISWMGSKDSEFLSKIKMAWDNYFSQNQNLMLIICGSASQWIEKNILSSTGFLGRVSYTLTLEELSIREASEFWNLEYSAAYEILKILMLTGGVPKYIEEIDKSMGAEKNIQHLCFSKGGFFVDEFNRIFSDLFLRDSKLYKSIITLLADGAKTMSQIAEDLDFSKSGRLSEYLTELEVSGFIKKDSLWDFKTRREQKTALYRLKDNYLRFYCKYIEPNRHKIEKNQIAFSDISLLKNWQSIFGLQFENLILQNRDLIYEKLNLRREEVECDGPYSQRTNACQIDYMIQDSFNTLYVCEAKFSFNTIGMSVIKEVEEKIKKLKRPKYMSIRPVLIHCNDVTKDLLAERYFYKIINIAEFIVKDFDNI